MSTLVLSLVMGALGLALIVQAVSGGGSPFSWSARISVEAHGAADAVALAAALVTRLAADAGLPAWPVVRAEAVREDILAEDAARPGPAPA